jgi:GDP-L-fucose synthase
VGAGSARAERAGKVEDAMKRESRIFVAGHRGLVGSALLRKLESEGYRNLILKTRRELDLLDQAAVHRFFHDERVEYVFLAAAKVGGIVANATYPADFLYENLVLGANVVHAAAENGVEKLLYLGSSCIYPRLAAQPIREESLLTSALEPTNEAYAIAKIAILKLCEKYWHQYQKRFISVMPTNLYGPNDDFHPEASHVIPGMMRRFHEAKAAKAEEVMVWGTGKPMREFLHVDDLANALVLLMEKYESPETINVGTGKDCTIAELAETMKAIVGYSGRIQFDPSKPDGTPRKVLDVSRVTALGWEPRYSLDEGLAQTYRWALENRAF